MDFQPAVVAIALLVGLVVGALFGFIGGYTVGTDADGDSHA